MQIATFSDAQTVNPNSRLSAEEAERKIASLIAAVDLQGQSDKHFLEGLRSASPFTDEELRFELLALRYFSVGFALVRSSVDQAPELALLRELAERVENYTLQKAGVAHALLLRTRISDYLLGIPKQTNMDFAELVAADFGINCNSSHPETIDDIGAFIFTRAREVTAAILAGQADVVSERISVLTDVGLLLAHLEALSNEQQLEEMARLPELGLLALKAMLLQLTAVKPNGLQVALQGRRREMLKAIEDLPTTIQSAGQAMAVGIQPASTAEAVSRLVEGTQKLRLLRDRFQPIYEYYFPTRWRNVFARSLNLQVQPVFSRHASTLTELRDSAWRASEEAKASFETVARSAVARPQKAAAQIHYQQIYYDATAIITFAEYIRAMDRKDSVASAEFYGAFREASEKALLNLRLVKMLADALSQSN